MGVLAFSLDAMLSGTVRSAKRLRLRDNHVADFYSHRAVAARHLLIDYAVVHCCNMSLIQRQPTAIVVLTVALSANVTFSRRAGRGGRHLEARGIPHSTQAV